MVGEDLAQPIHKMLSQGWVAHEAGQDSLGIPVSDGELICRAVLEAEVLGVPYACAVRQAVHLLMKFLSVLIGEIERL